MARIKNVKNNTILKVVPNDFTYNEPLKVIVRFNKKCVVDMLINLDALTLTGEVIDELNDVVYNLEGTLTPKE